MTLQVGQSATPEEAPPEDRAPVERIAWAGVILAFIAGGVDAVGYMVLAHVFIANMSGNSVQLGIYLAQGDWGPVLLHGFPIPLFFLGVGLGTLMVDVSIWRGVRSSFAPVFGLEALAIVVFLSWGSGYVRDGVIPTETGWQFYVLVALLTTAMGLQTATLHRVSGLNVRTTYVTGVLTDLAHETVQYFLAGLNLRNVRRAGDPSVHAEDAQRRSGRKVWLLGSIWGSYVVGAICGGFLELQMALLSLLLPLGFVLLLTVLDLVMPINAAREAE